MCYCFVLCLSLMCCNCCSRVFLFFKQKTAYDMRISDWSSDVCSSDLHGRHSLHVPRRCRGCDAPWPASSARDRQDESGLRRSGGHASRMWQVRAGSGWPPSPCREPLPSPKLRPTLAAGPRSAESRVGKEVVSPCRSRSGTCPEKKKN